MSVSRVLVTGTLAIDYVADYGGRFSQLPRHPGVNLSRVPDFAARLTACIADRRPDYAVLAPDIAVNMTEAARVMRSHGIPFLSDPGQGLTDFSPGETSELLALSNTLIVNPSAFRTTPCRTTKGRFRLPGAHARAAVMLLLFITFVVP